MPFKHQRLRLGTMGGELRIYLAGLLLQRQQLL